MSTKQFYTVQLGFAPPPRQEREFKPFDLVGFIMSYVVEAEGLFPNEQDLFDRAVQQLRSDLLVWAASVQPWAVSYTVGGDRRITRDDVVEVFEDIREEVQRGGEG
ncbi:MAG: hypothetical protein OEW46_13120 [Actinomycetota bacterium]|nr:hypothetical protein [Actinomycetota bacterium]